MRSFFEMHGFEVDRLVASNVQKRADFAVRHRDETYIVEVKSRPGDSAYERDFAEQGFAISEEKLGRTNVVSGIVRDAERQLSQTSSEATTFRVLAFVPQGEDPDTQLTQVKHALYGIVDILIPGTGNTAQAIPCFYFTHSDFFRFPSLHGALLMPLGSSLLCVNDLADQVEEFRKSELHRLHAVSGAIVDPPVDERERFAFVADPDMDRSSEGATVDCIKQKYELQHAVASTPTKLRVGAFPREGR